MQVLPWQGVVAHQKLPPCSNKENSDGWCAGYLAYLGLVQYGLIKPRKTGRQGRKVETKKKVVDSDEWLKGTHYNQVPFCPPNLSTSAAWLDSSCRRMMGLYGQKCNWLACVHHKLACWVAHRQSHWCLRACY